MIQKFIAIVSGIVYLTGFIWTFSVNDSYFKSHLDSFFTFVMLALSVAVSLLFNNSYSTNKIWFKLISNILVFIVVIPLIFIAVLLATN